MYHFLLSSETFMPHGHCYLWKPSLVWTMAVSDTLICLAYLFISANLYALVRKIKLPFSWMIVAFGIFIAACGLTHAMEVWNIWQPMYWLSAAIKVITAVASVTTAALLVPTKSKIVE